MYPLNPKVSKRTMLVVAATLVFAVFVFVAHLPTRAQDSGAHNIYLPLITSRTPSMHYKDPSFGYEFDHPADWIIVEPPSNGWGGGVQILTNSLLSSTLYSRVDTLPSSNLLAEIHVLENSYNFTPDEFIQYMDAQLGEGFQSSPVQNTVVDGKAGIVRQWQQGETNGVTYYIFVDSTIYAIQKQPLVSAYDKQFDDLLTTLKLPSQRVQDTQYLKLLDLPRSRASTHRAGSAFPAMKFPWKQNDQWYFTGGPHSWNNSSSLPPSGLDFSPENNGRDIFAVTGGTVTFAGWLDGSSGNVIKIDHGNSWETWYLHLAANSFNVHVGNQIPQGGYIAIAGGTGGHPVHIHIELLNSGQHYAWNGNVIDGWQIYETCSGYTSSESCISGNYNGYMQNSSGRQVVPQSSPGANQLVASSNAPIYACFPGVSAASGNGPCDPAPTPGPAPTNTPPPSSGGVTVISAWPQGDNISPNQEFHPDVVVQTSGFSLNCSQDFLQNRDGNLYGTGPNQGCQSLSNNQYRFYFNTQMKAPGSSGTYHSQWQIWHSPNHVGPVIDLWFSTASQPSGEEGVYLCRTTDYGNCLRFTADTPNLGATGFGNDVAQSIRIIGDWSAVLYEHNDYGGQRAVFDGSDPDLINNVVRRNDASSLRVRKRSPARFTLFAMGDNNGDRWSSDRDIKDLGHWDFNDRAESVCVESGYEAVFFEHADYHGIHGRTRSCVGDVNSLAAGLRDRVTSIRVCAGNCPASASTPTLFYPTNSSFASPASSVLLSWSGGSTGYLVEYWGGAYGNSPRSSGWIPATTWDIGVLPASSQPYWWHVKAENGYGESSWSSDYSFTVAEPTPTSTSLPPIAGDLLNSFEGGTDGLHINLTAENSATNIASSTEHATDGTKAARLEFNHNSSVHRRAIYQYDFYPSHNWSAYDLIQFDLWTNQPLAIALVLGTGPSYTWFEASSQRQLGVGNNIVQFNLKSTTWNGGGGDNVPVADLNDVRYLAFLVYPAGDGQDAVLLDNLRLYPGQLPPTETFTPTPMATNTPLNTSTPTFSPTPLATNTPTPMPPTSTATPTSVASGVELLTSAWHLVGNNGAAEAYQSIPATVLQGKNMLRITYNLYGLRALGGDASAIIFDQNGWRYISLSNYGQNGLNGVQTVDIPLANFPGLNPNGTVGTLHTRFWYSGPFVVDITSIIAYSSQGGTSTPTATPMPAATSTPMPTPTATPNSGVNGVELLTSPWHLVGNNGAAEAYQNIARNALQGKNTLRITYNLHGLTALGGDASAIIFDQNGWRYISLANYGQNGLDGVQTVDIPLSAFPGLNPNANVGTLHTRFWYNRGFVVDITSIVAYSRLTAASETTVVQNSYLPLILR